MNRLFFSLFLLSSYLISAQETLPIYSDYLSDNVYLLHPAAAGIGNTGKIRLTARQQWFGVDNAPSLQTLSFHAKAGADSKAAYGVILFNDKNGFHSQKGIQGTYGYHIDMGSHSNFNQLSFALSLNLLQNEVDQRRFASLQDDALISRTIQSDIFYGADFGMSYHYGGLSSYITVKNLFSSAKNHESLGSENINLRNYIIGAGYFFGDEKVLQFEPSFLFQYKEETGEKIADINLKVYKTISNTQFWAAVSYRSSFDGSIYGEAQYISPIIGVNYKDYMISYTYTSQTGDVVFSNGSFHQISLGMNVFKTKRRATACPNINTGLF